MEQQIRMTTLRKLNATESAISVAIPLWRTTTYDITSNIWQV